MRPVVAQERQRVTVNVTGCGFDPNGRNEIFTIFIDTEAKRATQHRMPPELISGLSLNSTFYLLAFLPIIFPSFRNTVPHLKLNYNNKQFYT